MCYLSTFNTFFKRKSLVSCMCLVNHLNSMTFVLILFFFLFVCVFFFNNFIQGKYLFLKGQQLNYLIFVLSESSFLVKIFVVHDSVCCVSNCLLFGILELYVHFANVLQKLTILREKRKLDCFVRSFWIL